MYIRANKLQWGGCFATRCWKSDRCKKISEKVNIHMRDIEMSGKMKRLKRKMEVQKITFNYFARPQPRNWNFFMQWWKILLSGFKICCGCMGWPGWERDFPAWNFVPVRPCQPSLLFMPSPVCSSLFMPSQVSVWIMFVFWITFGIKLHLGS